MYTYILRGGDVGKSSVLVMPKIFNKLSELALETRRTKVYDNRQVIGFKFKSDMPVKEFLKYIETDIPIVSYYSPSHDYNGENPIFKLANAQ